MYYLYGVDRTSDETHYVRRAEAHIFGRNVGEVPKLLRNLIDEAATEPFPWHIPIGSLLEAQRKCFVIDLKPKNKDVKASLSLYELRDVWGFSDSGWTPAMVRLRGISVDGDPAIDNVSDFTVRLQPQHGSIYTFLAFGGTVRNGTLEGPWTSTRRSSTNSVLLWPEALNYFLAQMRTTTPQVFGAGGADIAS